MATEEEVAPNEEEEIIDFEELRKMKVADLKAKLTELGLPSKGTKQELITRLEEYYTSQEDDEDLLDDEEVGAEEQEDGQEEEEEGEAEDGEEEEGEHVEESASETQKKPTEETGSEKDQPVKDHKVNVGDFKAMSSAERLAIRAQKFGVVGEDAKKLARAQRFGLSGDSSLPSHKKMKVDEETMEKLKKRAERFGESVSSAVVQAEDIDKIKKRQERFGIVTDNDKKSKRAERFGLS
jgi:SAP domain-containing ribonucleoprotein